MWTNWRSLPISMFSVELRNEVNGMLDTYTHTHTYIYYNEKNCYILIVDFNLQNILLENICM